MLSAWTKDGLVRLILNPDDEDLAGWTSVAVPDDYDELCHRWTGTEFVLDLTYLKAAKQLAISDGFKAATLAGCMSPKGKVDCDEVAQGRVDRMVRLIEKAQQAALPVPAVVSWTMYDKSQIDHSYADLVGLGIAIGFHFTNLFSVKQTKEMALEAATTRADIDDIDTHGGYPS